MCAILYSDALDARRSLFGRTQFLGGLSAISQCFQKLSCMVLGDRDPEEAVFIGSLPGYSLPSPYLPLFLVFSIRSRFTTIDHGKAAPPKGRDRIPYRLGYRERGPQGTHSQIRVMEERGERELFAPKVKARNRTPSVTILAGR